MRNNRIKKAIMAISALFVFVSCTDVWDDHYVNNGVTNKSSLNMYEYISSQPDLLLFSNMLQMTGYDTILSKSQTYTVWAPSNTSLANVNFLDTNVVLNVVKNHISRFSFPTSGIDKKEIYMLDKKYISFNRSNSGFTFGGIDLDTAKSNVAVKNGIVHTINGFVPYKSNIWEFIGVASGLDSLRNYLYSQSVYKFDAKSSVEIGTNQYGQSVYDSVITLSNPILSKVGALNIEDSVYTGILPNNTAWTKAYNKVKSGYKTFGLGAEDSTRKYTQNSIVQNLFFKREVTDTTGLTSLTTTTGTTIANPGYLFQGTERSDLSNGYAYITDSLRFKAADSYQKTIVVEGESSAYGRSYSTNLATLNVQSSLGTTFSGQVSNDKYLVVVPTNVNDNSPDTVSFPIPNTLSGKYRIYCVFVPTNIVDASSAKTNKVKFFFSYLDYKNNAATVIKDAVITAVNKVVVPPTAISTATFTTKANQITKMFVTEFTFPYCNLYTESSATSSIKTKLKVVNASKIVDEINGKSDRTMRIDCVVLEPVQ